MCFPTHTNKLFSSKKKTSTGKGTNDVGCEQVAPDTDTICWYTTTGTKSHDATIKNIAKFICGGVSAEMLLQLNMQRLVKQSHPWSSRHEITIKSKLRPNTRIQIPSGASGSASGRGGGVGGSAGDIGRPKSGVSIYADKSGNRCKFCAKDFSNYPKLQLNQELGKHVKKEHPDHHKPKG